MFAAAKEMATLDQEIKSKFESDKQRAIVNLMFTSNWITGLFTDFLKPFNLSAQQFNILRILRGAKDWIAMNDVKRVMVEKSPNTTRLVDKLLAKDLIERRRSESDRRVVFVKITSSGLKLLKEIDKANIESSINFMDNISGEQALELSNILDKLRG